MGDRKEVDPEWRGRWGATGRSRELVNHSQDVLNEKKIVFIIKEKEKDCLGKKRPELVLRSKCGCLGCKILRPLFSLNLPVCYFSLMRQLEIPINIP